MKTLLKTLALTLLLFAGVKTTHAAVSVDFPTYTAPATVNYTGVGNVNFGMALYKDHGSLFCGNDGSVQGWPSTSGDLAAACGTAYRGDGEGTFDGTMNGDYELIEYFGTTCQPGGVGTAFDDYTTCVAAQGGNYHEADFTISGGSGGGGGTPIVIPFGTGTTTCSTNGATTTCASTMGTGTVDNPTQDLFYGFILFYMVGSGVIWFFRKR